MSSESCVGIKFLHLFSFDIFLYFLQFFLKQKTPSTLDLKPTTNETDRYRRASRVLQKSGRENEMSRKLNYCEKGVSERQRASGGGSKKERVRSEPGLNIERDKTRT